MYFDFQISIDCTPTKESVQFLMPTTMQMYRVWETTPHLEHVIATELATWNNTTASDMVIRMSMRGTTYKVQVEKVKKG